MVTDRQITNTGHHRKLGTTFVVISATGFGLMGAFARYAYQANLNVVTLTSLRFLIAAVAMWSVLLIKGENPRVGGKQLLALTALGAVGFSSMSSFYFNAVKLIPVSITVIVVYTYPVIVSLLTAWVYDGPITSVVYQ